MYVNDGHDHYVTNLIHNNSVTCIIACCPIIHCDSYSD